MAGEIASSISEELPPGFPKKCKREFLLQPTLQRLWTASHSLRYCSDTEESLIRYYSMSESYKVLFADVGKEALLSNHQDYNDRHKDPLCLSGGLSRIIVFICYVRILMWLPCSRMTFYYIRLCTRDERQWIARLLARYLGKTLNPASQRLNALGPLWDG